jgi:cholesterol oxidase
MARLSLPLERIKPHYTVVVVGSGYGGAIAASRLARSGQAVCLLERGREIEPGDYPDTLAKAARAMQVDTPAGHVGSPTGLYDFRVNPDVNVFQGCGLGGTSLVNANVSLRPEPRLFDDPRWPAELRGQGCGPLEEGYRRAEDMLRPMPYPETFPPLPKQEALRQSAAAMGERFYRTPINVTFADGVNQVGVEQRACVLCGDCVSGCNHGAKNTTLMNYLPDAVNHGAEIFTGVAVRHVERRDGRWLVFFRPLEVGRESFGGPDLLVSADVVVLGAGSLGSTEILLRSRAQGLALSDRLGERFTGNGDVLAVGYNLDVTINGIGWGAARPGELPPVGPCITGVIDIRDQPVLEDGLVIEEGSIPGALGPIMPELAGLAAAGFGRWMGQGLADLIRAEGRFVLSELGRAHAGAMARTQTYLVMSQDDGHGRLVLQDDRLRVDWPEVGSRPPFARDNAKLEAATRPHGGKFIINPIWSPLLGHRIITVHPLGGCVMAGDAAAGVVNHKGQVFAGPSGAAVHAGLYVCDGAIVPRPLGVNPLLTISALAERVAALLARDHGWVVEYGFSPVPRRVPAAPRPGIRFTECMKGFFARGETADFSTGAERGRAENSPLEFVLTVVSRDLERMLSDSGHEAGMFGTVVAPRLSAAPMTAHGARFNLFTVDEADPQARRMRYRMTLAAVEGRTYFFDGFKLAVPAGVTDVWPATSTLYITVHDGPDETSPVLGKGVLTIHKEDFARQMTTLAALDAAGTAERLSAVERFGRFFAGQLFEVYGAGLRAELGREGGGT